MEQNKLPHLDQLQSILDSELDILGQLDSIYPEDWNDQLFWALPNLPIIHKYIKVNNLNLIKILYSGKCWMLLPINYITSEEMVQYDKLEEFCSALDIIPGDEIPLSYNWFINKVANIFNITLNINL